MAQDKKPKKKETVFKITSELVSGITHGCPESSTLVKDLNRGKAVKTVHVYKDEDGSLYLVLKE